MGLPVVCSEVEADEGHVEYVYDIVTVNVRSGIPTCAVLLRSEGKAYQGHVQYVHFEVAVDIAHNLGVRGEERRLGDGGLEAVEQLFGEPCHLDRDRFYDWKVP